VAATEMDKYLKSLKGKKQGAKTVKGKK